MKFNERSQNLVRTAQKFSQTGLQGSVTACLCQMTPPLPDCVDKQIVYLYHTLDKGVYMNLNKDEDP